MSHNFFPLLWSVVTVIFWLAVAIAALVRRDRGRWWMLVACGAGLLALMAVVEHFAWWLYSSSGSYSPTSYGLLVSALSVIDFVGLALVVLGAFLDRPRRQVGPGHPLPSAPAAPMPYPER